MAEEILKSFISYDDKTFGHDDSLPSLPLPELEETLTKYLDSVKPFTNDEEFSKTKRIVKEFEAGVGRVLHRKLLEKSQKERNWLEKWWEDVAYLRNRKPLVPLSNMGGVFDVNLIPDDEEEEILQRIAVMVHHMLQFWKNLRTESFKPVKSNDVYLSMHQWRRIFNTCRIPGEEVDQLCEYFKTEADGSCGPTVIIVLHKGRIFMFDAVESGFILSPAELIQQMKFILSFCADAPKGLGLGVLTCDERTSWFHNRERLISLDKMNAENLRLIESSLLVMVLDEFCPTTDKENMVNCLGGDVKNRWADKTSPIFTKNGQCSINVEHTPYESIAPSSMAFYSFVAAQITNGNIGDVRHSLKNPVELHFVVDEVILRSIDVIAQKVQSDIDRLDVAMLMLDVCGKDFLTSFNRNPDYVVQLALQLCYWRTHFKPAATYETAQTKRFWHGRTETVRSCTLEVISWCKAMMDPQCTIPKKMHLFDKAYSKHKQLISEASMNRGCDRHLLGLYLTSLEEGIEIPKLYQDPSFTKSGGSGNFILSTSFLGFYPGYGMVAAMCDDGYGVFYSVQSDTIKLSINSFKDSTETSSEKFKDNIIRSMQDIKELLSFSSNL